VCAPTRPSAKPHRQPQASASVRNPSVQWPRSSRTFPGNIYMS
jgi:hypothetical protein